MLLSPTERARLVALLGMLGSDFDGERASAGLLATRLLKAKGLTWDALITARLATEEPPSRRPRPEPEREPDADGRTGLDWRATAARCCSRYPGYLTAWERDFMRGLPRFPRLSRKQRDTLSGIVQRLRAQGCAV